MQAQELIDYCLKKKGAYVDFPFGDSITVIKVKGRIFVQLFILKGVLSVTLNCSKEGGMFYREMFPNVVVRGYHCPSIQQPYFNTFALEGSSVPDEVIFQMADHSYSYVVSKLPKYVQAQLAGE